MTMPENTHIKRITKIMATLLTGRVDRIPQELPGLIRARGNPAGRKSLHGKTSGLRDSPQAVCAFYLSPSARTIGRLMIRPEITHNMKITSSMMPPKKNAEAPRPLRGRDDPRRVEKWVEPGSNLSSQ